METPSIKEISPLDDNVNVVQLALVVLRGKRRIALTGTVFALAGLAFALTQRPVFTANTEILPPHAASASSIMNQMNAVQAVSSLSGMASALEAKNAADTYTAMLAVRPVQDDLIDKYGLRSIYHTNSMATARAALEGQTTIAPTKEGFIAISVKDHDPKRAMLLANGYVDALRDLMHGLALTQASQRRIFYEGQLARSKADLAQAEVAFKQMQQSSHVISVDAQSKALIDSAAELRAQIAAKEVELQALRSYSTEENPQVEITERELEALRLQQSHMDTSNQGSYSDVGLSSVPGAELNYVRASREMKYQETLYDILMRQYEGARIDEAQDAPVVQVIEPAILPERKSGPHRSWIVLGAFVVGLIFGTLWVLYRGWRDGLSETERVAMAELRKVAFRWSS